MQKLSNVVIPSGKFVTVTFVKNDGTIRSLNGRVGVKKYLKGTGKPRSQNIENRYFLLWTRDGNKAFSAARNIAKDRIISVRGNGIKMQRNENSAYADFV